eukprot:1025880-Prymnesium_polylepis.1
MNSHTVARTRGGGRAYPGHHSGAASPGCRLHPGHHTTPRRPGCTYQSITARGAGETVIHRARRAGVGRRMCASI